MLNAAHEHGAAAEEALGQGLLIPASEEHFKARQAAEAYQKALERSNDESTKRTLRMLENEHRKAAKDLTRRIELLKAQGKDPNAPKRPDVAQSSRSSHPSTSVPRSAPSPPPNRPMSDSQGTVDESFMLLGGQRSDPGDAFNRFWGIMEGMLDNLSQPVAFATAPLGVTDGSSNERLPRNEENLSSDTDIEEPMVARFARKLGMSGDSRRSLSSSKPKIKPPPDDDNFDDGDLAESFIFIPSDADAAAPASLKKDNASLKLEVESLKKRLDAAERALQVRREQDATLRDSIFLATKEAQRAMGQSIMLPPQSSIQREIPGFKTGREVKWNFSMRYPVILILIVQAQYARRVKELEDEVRALKNENDKQKSMIVRYQEKWEKLKESAKRRKAANAAAASSNVSRQKIEEEPEPEPDGKS
ncbi:hypothetical protein MKEN_01185200 [Mycena kentingensis (nom. inval.)]|nr:hypothetical protein MKEN_01185200 [Mycena kentingensis (nom. inval.)]